MVPHPVQLNRPVWYLHCPGYHPLHPAQAQIHVTPTANGLQAQLAQHHVRCIRERPVHYTGFYPRFLYRLHQLVSQSEVIRQPRPDRTDLLVVLRRQEPRDPPAAKAGKVTDDLRGVLLQELSCATDVKEVDTLKAKVWVVTEVVGSVKSFLYLELAFLLVNIRTNHLDGHPHAGDLVHHIMPHATRGADDQNTVKQI